MCVECAEKYCESCFMSFHQKGALKKHSTQTLEQVRTVIIFRFFSYDRGGGGVGVYVL